MALSGLLFGIISNAFAIMENDPAFFNGHRCFLVLPFLCFLTAQGIDWAVRFMAARPKPIRITGILLLVIIMVCSVSMNINNYFFKFEVDHDNRWYFSYSAFSIADVIKSYYPKDHVVCEGKKFTDQFICSNYDSPEIFLTYQQVKINEGTPLAMPIKAQVTKNVVLLFSDWQEYDAEKVKVQQLYPRAVWKDYKDEYGVRYLATVEIPMENIQVLQKGIKLDPLLN